MVVGRPPRLDLLSVSAPWLVAAIFLSVYAGAQAPADLEGPAASPSLDPPVGLPQPSELLPVAPDPNEELPLPSVEVRPPPAPTSSEPDEEVAPSGETTPPSDDDTLPSPWTRHRPVAQPRQDEAAALLPQAPPDEDPPAAAGSIQETSAGEPDRASLWMTVLAVLLCLTLLWAFFRLPTGRGR